MFVVAPNIAFQVQAFTMGAMVAFTLASCSVPTLPPSPPSLSPLVPNLLWITPLLAKARPADPLQQPQAGGCCCPWCLPCCSRWRPCTGEAVLMLGISGSGA